MWEAAEQNNRITSQHGKSNIVYGKRLISTVYIWIIKVFLNHKTRRMFN